MTSTDPCPRCASATRPVVQGVILCPGCGRVYTRTGIDLAVALFVVGERLIAAREQLAYLMLPDPDATLDALKERAGAAFYAVAAPVAPPTLAARIDHAPARTETPVPPSRRKRPQRPPR